MALIHLRLERSISNCAIVAGCGRSVDTIEGRHQRGRGIGISHGANKKLKKEFVCIFNDIQ